MDEANIYFDYAAATPLDNEVRRLMEPYFSDKFYNPSALYLFSRAVNNDIQQARSQVAKCLGAKTSEIIFTAGGTEANNLAIHGLMRQHPGANLIVSSVEHESILKPSEQYKLRLATVDADGRIDTTSIRNQIDDNTLLISVMYANNEVGTIQPIKELAQQLIAVRADRQNRGIKQPIYLHSDACQAANYLDLQTARLGVDLLTLNGGKIYGPKQSGVLFVKAGVKLEPQVLGGGQERGMRSGTENVANIIGFAAALDAAQNKRLYEAKRLIDLQKQFLKLLQDNISIFAVNGSLKHRLPNNVHLTVSGKDNERLLMQLDERGIMCATGSACTASNQDASHVLKAIGLSEADARSSLRFTMGRGTTPENIVRVVTELSILTAA